MNVYEVIYAHLHELAKTHTQAEIASMTGVTQQHIQRLLSSKNGLFKISRMELCTLLKMFPGLEIHFPWEKSEGIHQHHNGQAIAVTGGTAHVNTPLPSADHTDEILNDTTICPACKVKVLKILRSKA